MKTEARCGQLSWWNLILDKLAALRESEYPGGVGHACELETSMYLHFDGEGVRRDRIQKEIAWNVSPHWYKDFAGGSPLSYTSHHDEYSRTGVAGDPTVATAAKGAAIAETFYERLPEVARAFRDVVDHPRFPRPERDAC